MAGGRGYEFALRSRLPVVRNILSKMWYGTIQDDRATIERYVVATFARFERAVVAQLPALAEPRVADLDLALRRLGFLVETLCGFAVGAAVGAVAREARRGFGEEVRERVGVLVGRIVEGGSRATAASELAPPERLVRAPGRPLVDAAGGQLLARLRRSMPETRTHVTDIHAEVMRVAPARLPTFVALLERLVGDDAPALAFAEQLVLGWQHYAAMVSERRSVRSPGAGKREGGPGPWRAWTDRIGGRAAPLSPAQGELVAEGFLLQIA